MIEDLIEKHRGNENL